MMMEPGEHTDRGTATALHRASRGVVPLRVHGTMPVAFGFRKDDDGRQPRGGAPRVADGKLFQCWCDLALSSSVWAGWPAGRPAGTR